MGHSAHSWVGQSAHMVFNAKSHIGSNILYIIYTNIHRSYNNKTLLHTFGGQLMSIRPTIIYLYINIYDILYYIQFM